MSYLLDTDVIINHIRKKERLKRDIIKEGIAISIISYGELLFGVYKSSQIQFNMQLLDAFLHEFSVEVLVMNKDSMHEFGKLKSLLESEGNKSEDFDLLIAAIAITNNLTLVTKNMRHFDRIPRLQLYSEKE